MFGRERESFEYHITILNVRMKVKFPCRMKIEHMGSLITGQTAVSNENVYIFNQEIILRDEHKRECFQFTVNLITEIGSKYIAGVITLYHSEMIRSEGETLTLTLAKCIDNRAFCEIRIDQVLSLSKNLSRSRERNSSIQKSNFQNRQRQSNQVEPSPVHNIYLLNHMDSKTQYQYSSKGRLIPPRSQWNSNNHATNQTIKSPIKQSIGTFQQYSQFQTRNASRDKVIEETGYKQAYKQLKQKHKKDAQLLRNQCGKRIVLQNNENALKLQVKKYKIRLEQLQKQLADRNLKIKQSQELSRQLYQKQSQNSYLREQVKMKGNNILSLEDTIQSLTCDIEELSEVIRDKNAEESQKSKQLRLQNQSLKSKILSKQREIEYLKRDYEQVLKQKNDELNLKNAQIERDHKMILNLEKSIQAKIYEHEKNIQNERRLGKQKLEEESSALENRQIHIQVILNEKTELKKKLEQLELRATKQQFQKKMIRQQSQSLRSQCQSLRQFRQKYNQVAKQNKMMAELKNQLELRVQKLIQNKNENQSQINKQFQDQVQYFKRNCKQSQQKYKSNATRVNQLETLLSQAKNQTQKLRKNVQIATKEAIQAKQKQKNTKRILKEKQSGSLGIQSQYATLKQKIKNIDQIYKLQIDKIKQENQRSKSTLQSEKTKAAEAIEKCNKLQNQIVKLKQQLANAYIKASKSEELRIEKEYQNKSQSEQAKMTIIQLQTALTNIKNLQKQNVFKIQKLQQDLHTRDEKIQKQKKDYKLLEEKYLSQEQTLKAKLGELNSIFSESNLKEGSLSDLKKQNQEIKNQILIVSTEKTRLTKVTELIQQDLTKTKAQLQLIKQNIEQKDKKQQQLSTIINNQKHELEKLELKCNSFKKDTQRVKQSVIDLINKNIVPLIKSKDTSLQLSKSQSGSNQLLSQLALVFKQMKQYILKEKENVGSLQRQCQRQKEQLSKTLSLGIKSQNELKADILALQEQLQKMFQQKTSQSLNFTAVINEMKKNLEQKQNFEEQMHNQIEQLNFNINSLKMDFQAVNDQNTRKINNLRKINADMEFNIEQNVISIGSLEQRIKFLEGLLSQKQVLIEQANQLIQKKQKDNLQLKQIIDTQRKQLESNKKQKIQFMEKIAEIDMHLSTEKDLKQKTKQQLEQEQMKSSQTKNFVNNLMKQRQQAIKKELLINDQMMKLQDQVIQKQKNIQLLTQQNQKLVSSSISYKENIKMLTNNLKQMEQQLRQERLNRTRSQERYKQKQLVLFNKQQTFKKVEDNYAKNMQKLKNQIEILQQEIQSIRNDFMTQIRGNNDKIVELQGLLQEKISESKVISQKNLQIEEKMFDQHQKIVVLEQSLISKNNDIQQLKKTVIQFDGVINELNEELRQKDQRLFDMSDKNYALDLKMQADNREKYLEMQKLQIQFNNKYQTLCEEYETKIQMNQKQLRENQRKILEKQRQVEKKTSLIRQAQQSEIAIKKRYEEIIKKLQQDKIAYFSSKNVQFQRLNDQNRLTNQNLKQKQVQLKRINSQIEILRRTLSSSQTKIRELDDKLNYVTKQQRNQSEQFRKKQSEFKTFRETVSTTHWNMERQVKKTLQQFVRNLLEIGDQKNSSKIIEVFKNLEAEVFEVITAKNKQFK